MRGKETYPHIQIEIEESKWLLDATDFFEIVFRKNKKRRFLFASKVIGKYIPVTPWRALLTGRLLAMAWKDEIEPLKRETINEGLRCWKEGATLEELGDITTYKMTLEEKTLFIGFAETATGLGHGVFSCFEGNVDYVHTTRNYFINEEIRFKFQEEHSHAVDHRCYIKELVDIENYKQIVLVDDELTTGKTALNLIKAIVKEWGVTKFVVLSLLDWRTKEDIRRFEALEEALNITIKSVALIKGQLRGKVEQDLEHIVSNQFYIEWEKASVNSLLSKEQKKEQTLYFSVGKTIDLDVLGKDECVRKLTYLAEATGRFGITSQKNRILVKQLKEIGQQLKHKRNGGKCLCLGSEEFIFIPNQIACFMGENVYFACSARSPIITMDTTDYVLKDSFVFTSPEDTELPIYVYNIQYQEYEEIFWFLERDVDGRFKQKISESLKENGVKNVYFVVLSDRENNKRRDGLSQ